MPIIITAKRDGFRRCGIAHPGTPTTYQDDAFTAEQLQALQAEPMLVVHVTADDTSGKSGTNTEIKAEAKAEAKAEPKAEEPKTDTKTKKGKE